MNAAETPMPVEPPEPVDPPAAEGAGPVWQADPRRGPGPVRRFRFHLLGLAHLPTHRDCSPCAYTQKTVKLARMLKSLGHQVVFYGGEGSEVECDEFVPVVTAADRLACYGDY